MSIKDNSKLQNLLDELHSDCLQDLVNVVLALYNVADLSEVEHDVTEEMLKKISRELPISRPALSGCLGDKVAGDELEKIVEMFLPITKEYSDLRRSLKLKFRMKKTDSAATSSVCSSYTNTPEKSDPQLLDATKTEKISNMEKMMLRLKKTTKSKQPSMTISLSSTKESSTMRRLSPIREQERPDTSSDIEIPTNTAEPDHDQVQVECDIQNKISSLSKASSIDTTEAFPPTRVISAEDLRGEQVEKSEKFWVLKTESPTTTEVDQAPDEDDDDLANSKVLLNQLQPQDFHSLRSLMNAFRRNQEESSVKIVIPKETVPEDEVLDVVVGEIYNPSKLYLQLGRINLVN